jgi:LPS-assembly protein
MGNRAAAFFFIAGVFAAVLLVGLPLPAICQMTGASDPSHFDVSADFIDSLDGGRFLSARGNVRITRGDWTLYADEVEIDQGEETFLARGSVLLFDRGNQIQGRALQYNYVTGRGVIYEAQGFILPATTFTAEEAHREDDRTYRLVGVRYTSCTVCQPPPYDWEIRAAEVTVHPEEFAWGTHGTFWVKGVPALYVPIFRHPLTERETGFLTPRFGKNSKEGLIIGQEFFWAISESQDATVGVVYRSERGVGPTVEYRYMLEDGHGSLNAEYLRDRELDKDRYVVQFRHEQQFASDLAGKADINVRSDRDFPREFTIGFRDRSNLVNSSSAFVTYVLPRHTFSVSGEFHESRQPDLPDEDESLLRAPELTFTSLSQPLWDEAPVLFDQRSGFVYFDKKDDVRVARLDVHPSVSLPIAPTSYLALTPRVGLRETFYSRGASEIESDVVTREMVEMEAELSARFFRTFPLEGDRVRALRHTVEPAIRYLYIPDVVQDDLPQVDATDFVSPQNRFFLSLTNRFSASLQEPDGSRRSFDFLTLTVETSVTPDPRRRTFSDLFLDSLQPENVSQAVKENRVPVPGRPGFSRATERDFADIVARMSVTPPWPLSLDASTSFNSDAGHFDTANAMLNASLLDIASLRLGYTFSRGSDQDAWIGELGLKVVEGVRLSYLGRFDADREVFVEHQAGVVYETCCWALNVVYTRRDTEGASAPSDDIRVNFELLTAPSRR